ncbi:hypothetical protein A6779_17820 [Marinobacter adhaerens]|uniref:pPIWI-associating nuclease domain-containing protein n=1 Tax=Marinobacter adhaerens TaxID=1033846 RepID=UPI000840E7D9|nr:hypothetical protein [Marinobacter adhaerens]ODM31422.1 hypothetical protein A6779_17820 [Marinobacter adhaerens]
MKLKKLLSHGFIEEFNSHLSTDFENELFVSALRNYCSHGNPLRFHNFSFAMRELLRHVLNRKAPDSKVRKCIWFSPQLDDPEKATRGQKLKYCMQGGIQDHLLSEEIREDVKESISSYQDQIEALNSYTHVGEATLGISPRSSYQSLKKVIVTFNNAMSIIEDGKRDVLDHIPETLFDYVRDELTNEIPNSLDELSSHSVIDWINFEGFQVVDVDEQFLYIIGDGTVHVTLQYGSSSDLKRGDGAIINDSFPLQFDCKARANKPKGAFVVKESISVVTDSWRE